MANTDEEYFELKVEDEKRMMSQPPIQLSDAQFNQLLSKLDITSKMSNKNFTRCDLQFNGERDIYKVEEFVTAVEIYKKIENISDDDALTGFPLLLKGNASTWWQGVRAETKTWSAAIKNLQSAFAPKRQPYEIYMELFATPQGGNEGIDEFLCRKRALLGLLPPKRHKEDEEIDLVYGLLKLSLKKKIGRNEIKTFAHLLERARALEVLEKEEKLTSTSGPSDIKRKIKRCVYCGKKGHLIEECHKRLANFPKPTEPTENEKGKPFIKCYGCGAPGVFRSNCDTCKAKESPAKPVSFYAMQATLENHVKIPTIEVSIKGKQGYAFIDTAARTSVASTQLYQILKDTGEKFNKITADVSLADGSTKTQVLLNCTVDIVMGNKILPITFTILPDATDNRTLLGIDFLETAGITLNLPQRVWSFIDKPNEMFQFLQLKPEKSVKRKIIFDDSGLSDFLKWTSELKMLSPMTATPSPSHTDTANPSEKRPRWELIKLPQLAVSAKILCLLMVVICGAVPSMVRSVRLYSQCSHHYVNVFDNGTVMARPGNDQRTPNLTISTRGFSLELLIHSPVHDMYLCFNRSRLVGRRLSRFQAEKQPNCLFKEEFVDGYNRYHLTKNQDRYIGFNRRGYQLRRGKSRLSERLHQCFSFMKVAHDFDITRHNNVLSGDTRRPQRRHRAPSQNAIKPPCHGIRHHHGRYQRRRNCDGT